MLINPVEESVHNFKVYVYQIIILYILSDNFVTYVNEAEKDFFKKEKKSIYRAVRICNGKF